MRLILFFSLLCYLALAEEKVVAGIAITVNGDPITLYEIEQIQQEQKISREKTVDFLIAQKLKNQEIKRLKIEVSDARIDDEIQNMAYRSGTTIQGFFAILKKQEGISPKTYKKQLKEQIQTQELMRSILLSSANNTGEDEMLDYYNKHQEEFKMPKQVLVVRYSANNTELLQEAIKNPDTLLRGVERVQEKMSLDSLAPQIAQVFITTENNHFTTILNAGNDTYVTFLIKDKIGIEQISFQQAKNFIAQKLIEKRQDKILEDYFEKIKQKASIITFRK